MQHLRSLPWFTPSVVPIDLFFFRRIFSRLYSQHGDQGEVPVSVFQRSVVRLFRLMKMDRQADDFSADEYDVDGSGAVGWYEFVTVWRKADVSVKLSLPERFFVLMEEPTSSFAGVVVSAALNFLIFGSCVGFMIGTMPDMKTAPCDRCEPEQMREFKVFESFCVGVFALEYLVRVCTAPFTRSELLHYESVLEFVTEHQVSFNPSRLLRFAYFVIQPMNLIDLFVIVPFFVEAALQSSSASNFTVLRVLRLTRLFRLVKLGKSFEVLQIIGRVFHKSIAMFWVFAVNFSLAMCFSAATIYFVEGGEWDPDEMNWIRIGHDGARSPSPFQSIPHSFWWVIVTFTTVGYGDVVPETFLGKMIGASSMIVGIIVLALPISVISTTFGDVWHEWKEELRLDAKSKEEDMKSVELALQVIQNRTFMHVEIYDHFERYPAELLGQTEWKSLPIDSKEKVEVADASYSLHPNEEKGLVEGDLGQVVVGYTWTPAKYEADGDRYAGTLKVRLQRAEGILKSDWRKEGRRNVFAVVRCWPKPPRSGWMGQGFDQQHCTKIAMGTLSPVWEESFEFDFDWPRDWRPQKVTEVEAQTRSRVEISHPISLRRGNSATSNTSIRRSKSQVLRRGISRSAVLDEEEEPDVQSRQVMRLKAEVSSMTRSLRRLETQLVDLLEVQGTPQNLSTTLRPQMMEAPSSPACEPPPFGSLGVDGPLSPLSETSPIQSPSHSPGYGGYDRSVTSRLSDRSNEFGELSRMSGQYGSQTSQESESEGLMLPGSPDDLR